jgi:hypothetical protein
MTLVNFTPSAMQPSAQCFIFRLGYIITLFEIITHVTLIHDVDDEICFGAVHEQIQLCDIHVQGGAEKR